MRVDVRDGIGDGIDLYIISQTHVPTLERPLPSFGGFRIPRTCFLCKPSIRNWT